MKTIRVCALALALLLAGCTGPVSGTTTTAAATATPVTVSPSIEATASPSASPSPSATASALPAVASSLHLSVEDYPVVDGSTATLPLAIAVRAAVTGETAVQSEEGTRFSTTGPAWLALQQGMADILIVYEASQTIQQELAGEYDKFLKTPIGLDALVFLANEGNPVESLTRQQIVDIYSGKTTNWKDVGGKDQQIVAFQRDENSGSQTLMKKLAMGGTPMMDAPAELRPSEMAGLITDLAIYNNSANALGYSVYYYVKNMYQAPGVKLLAVDGVAPTNDTIASGQYAYCNPFYAVIRADEPADSPAHKLYDWLTGAEGAAAVEAVGYVPANR